MDAASTLPDVLLIGAEPTATQALVDELRSRAPGLRLHPWRREIDEATLARCEVLLGWRLPAGLVARLPRLRWVCANAAGVDKLLTPELPAAVPLSRIVDPDQALGIAQYVAMVVLAWVRGLPQLQALQAQRRWQREAVLGAARHRVLVLGQGEIGRAIGQALAALGFAVQGWRRSSGPLAQALPTAQILVNALPLTPQTEGLLDARAFAALPRGAFVVNIARGGHVVEADLVAALQAGQLGGAALDVQQTEPLPADSPLWGVPGLFLSPHIASQSHAGTVAAQFLAGLQALQRGEPLPHLVDRARGY